MTIAQRYQKTLVYVKLLNKRKFFKSLFSVKSLNFGKRTFESMYTYNERSENAFKTYSAAFGAMRIRVGQFDRMIYIKDNVLNVETLTRQY